MEQIVVLDEPVYFAYGVAGMVHKELAPRDTRLDLHLEAGGRASTVRIVEDAFPKRIHLPRRDDLFDDEESILAIGGQLFGCKCHGALLSPIAPMLETRTMSPTRLRRLRLFCYTS